MTGSASPAYAAPTIPASAIASPDTLSQSAYVTGAAGTDLSDTLYSDGLDQAGTDCLDFEGTQGETQYSTVFLDFGAQDLSGTETLSVDNISQYSQSEIENMALSYAQGYATELGICYAQNTDTSLAGATPSAVFITIGTNNSGPAPTQQEASAQADAWQATADSTTGDFSSWVSSESSLSSLGVGADIQFDPGSDIETGFNSASATEPWAERLYADTFDDTSPTPSGFPQNFGSLDGCYNSSGTLTANEQCTSGWTVQQASDVVTFLQADPQIYLAPPNGEQPAEWTQMCNFSDQESGESILEVATVLSEPTGGSTYLSSSESYNDLVDELTASGDADCAGSPPLYETNFDEQATPSGNTTWPEG